MVQISLTSNFIFYQKYTTMAGILARKVEMTRVIKGDKFVPVTILEVPTLKVVGFKTIEKDGYEAILVGVPKKNAELKVAKGKKSLPVNQFSEIQEFDLSDGKPEGLDVGSDITLDLLEWVELVRVTWFSKWKWFTGAMKKHNFSGWPATHGSKFHRALGSIWNRKPKRTHKGKKMHGHHGNIKVTLKKVPLELVNKEASLIGVRWWVPGARNSLVTITF